MTCANGERRSRDREREKGKGCQRSQRRAVHAWFDGLPPAETLQKLGPESGGAGAEKNQIKGSGPAAGTQGRLMTRAVTQVKRLVCKMLCRCLGFQGGAPTGPLPMMQSNSLELKNGMWQPPERETYLSINF